MFGLESSVTIFIARRVTSVLALALLASAGMITAGMVPHASACTATSHCHTEAVNLNRNTNHGAYGEINAHCLYQPNNGNTATAEIWDSESSFDNWVEGGLISGVDYHGNYDNKNWFWADKRPGYSYSEHDKSVTANTDTTYPVEIEFAGSDTWNVYGENSFVLYGTSTNNSANINTAIGGTEFAGSSTSGIRDVGHIYNLERKSSSNTWYTWGDNAVEEELGTSNYISGNYNINAASESWSGPC